MREIKFRAWDSKLNEFSKNQIYIGSDGWVMDTTRDDGRDDLIISLSTGLKDKNGVEIYKGDIVVFDYADDELYEIQYYEAFGCYVARRGNMIKCQPLEVESLAEINIARSDYYNWVVVGNIHENPELMEV